MVRKIFERDGMNPVDRESAVGHLGYSSLNGASATALASLKQYGLTADAGKGMLQLTDLALDILEPVDEEGRISALAVAASNPDLFSSLNARFPETTPSEGNLRAHLLRQEFTSAAVKSIIPAYIDTIEYVASLEASERTGAPGDEATESSVPKTEGAQTMQSATLRSEPSRSTTTEKAVRRMIFDTEEGEVEFTYPDGLSPESVQDIEEWFALVTTRLTRATQTMPDAASIRTTDLT